MKNYGEKVLKKLIFGFSKHIKNDKQRYFQKTTSSFNAS
jgi:hypothetical protein